MESRVETKSEAVVQHFLQLLGCQFEYQFLIGNDQSHSLKCVFETREQAVALIDHLFSTPFSIGSTTSGQLVKKTAQSVEKTKWAVFIREDQLHDYYNKALAPLHQPNLAVFLESFSLKQHIYHVMAEAYPDKHNTSANIKLEVLNDKVKIAIKQPIFAEDFLKYLQKYIPLTNTKVIKEDHATFSITLTAEAFFRYVSIVPINHLYHHHTFEWLASQIAEKHPQDLFATLVKDLLGKYCYCEDVNLFNRQQITLKMISEYTNNHALVNVETILEDKVQDLIKAERLLFKIVKRYEELPNEFLYFQLERMANPGTKRTTRGLNLWFFPEATHIERQRHLKYNPQTQEWHHNPKQDERGAAKPARLHTKRTSVALSPADIGAAPRPWNAPSNTVYMLFDLHECEVHHKYIFNHDVGSDFEWWYGMPQNKAGIPDKWYEYFGANSLAFNSMWKTRSTNIAGLKAHNCKLHEQWKATGKTSMWAEMLSGLPMKLIRGIGARDNTLLDRLNALAAAYEAKAKFALDYNIPIFIVPANQPIMKYTQEQRIQDVMHALQDKNPLHPSEAILRSILSELQHEPVIANKPTV